MERLVSERGSSAPSLLYQLHYTSNVGTTYKRAIKRFHLSRDRAISRDFMLFTLIECVNYCSAFTVRRNRYNASPP